MGSKLVTARDIAIRDSMGSVTDWLVARSKDGVRRGFFTNAWDGKQVSGLPVQAFIDFGCWAAQCEACGGNLYVDPDEPVFFCLRCGNRNSAAARPVIFPDDKETIEDLLLARPIVDDPRARNNVEKAKLGRPRIDGLVRNWAPGMTIKLLRNQNKRIGGE